MPITLDGTTGITAPGVTDTGNLSVAGTATFTGAVSQTSSSTAASFIPSGSTVPVNGMYLSAANTLNFATNTTNQVSISSGGIVTGTAGNLMLVQGTAISTATTSFTGATTGASTALTASAITGTIAIGQVIAGTNITAGTTITAGSGTSWTISPASTGTVSGTITVVGVEFTGVPSWVKRVIVLFNNISTSGVSNIQVQIGSSSVTTTGYASSSVAANGSIVNVSSGFLQSQTILAANSYSGQSTIFTMGSNLYMAAGNLVTTNNTNNGMNNAGTVTLAGALDRVRITTVNGTDTFDAGSINIQYE